MSVNSDLLDGVVSVISALELTLNSDPVQVQKRKLPTSQESVDSLPLIAVVPSETWSVDEYFDTGGVNGRHWREYEVDVVIISQGNRDPVTNLDAYLSWRQQIARLFSQPNSLSVPELVQTRVYPDATIDRKLYSDNYDYSGLRLTFSCVEESA